MKYEKIIKGNFIERLNRFIAMVDVNSNIEKAHVKNTGRCQELLIPGAQIYLEDFQGRMGKRKLRYSLVGVKKGAVMINMDSQAPNKVVKESLVRGKLTLEGLNRIVHVKGECQYGNSRLDFYIEDERGRKGLIEVKGVTLEEDGVARFPDAPTERGVRHIQELMTAAKEGYQVYVLFVIQMKGISRFEPNDRTHKAFGDILRKASQNSVHVLAYDCIVREDTLELDQEVPVIL